MAIVPGMRIGPYEVGESIGTGGMGEVFRATDTSLKRDVALKVLPESFAEDADRLARFRREAELLASLNHSNIAQVYGLDESTGQAVIVMELVEGPTLADRITDGPLPPDEALGIARQVADALEAAHACQIVHRDLKPANVKLRPDGTVKVLDFGISKSIDAQAISGGRAPALTTPAVTEAGVIIGTAAYMSPEQARGRPVDARTDVWAFGCLLFEMLTGQPAFGAEDVMLTLARVLDRATDLSSVPASISPAVRNTIRLCLEKDPARRIADIRDARLALEGAFETALPRPPGRAARPAALPAAVVAVTAIATAAVMYVVLGGSGGEPPRAVSRSSFPIPESQQLVQPAVPAIAVSSDGRQVAFATTSGIYLRDLSEIDARLIPGTEEDLPVVPVFAPDGGSLLYRSNTARELRRIGIEGGTALPVLDPRLANGGWRWDLEDSITIGDDGVIRQLSPSGGEPTVLIEDPGFVLVEPAWLPGREHLIYERRDPGTRASEIAVHTIATGETSVLFPGQQPTYIDPGYLVYIDPTLGLMARTFDPATLAYRPPAPFVGDVMHPAVGGGAQYRLSPSGTLIYIPGATDAAEPGRVLAMVDASGVVAPLDVPPDNYSRPSVSPDGQQLAVQIGNANDDAQVFVYDLSGASEMRQLTYEGRNGGPTWSPDGQWIAFASDRDGRSRIYRKRADGRGLAEPLTDAPEGRDQRLPTWTPDGERLAYTEADTDVADSRRINAELRIVSLPDGTPELLAGGEGSQIGAAFTPDGTAFVYMSVTSDGSFEVIVEPFPPEGSRLRVSRGIQPRFFPAFSGDGATLAYQVNGGIEAVDIDTRAFTMQNRRMLLSSAIGNPGTPRFTAIPQTNRFIVSLPASSVTVRTGERMEIVIVENWIEEVKARLPLD